jgi:hypothetical protein
VLIFCKHLQCEEGATIIQLSFTCLNNQCKGGSSFLQLSFTCLNIKVKERLYSFNVRVFANKLYVGRTSISTYLRFTWAPAARELIIKNANIDFLIIYFSLSNKTPYIKCVLFSAPVILWVIFKQNNRKSEKNEELTGLCKKSCLYLSVSLHWSQYVSLMNYMDQLTNWKI